MGGALLEAFRHSAWANRQLLDALSALTADQLAVSLPTGQGTPLVTMKHLVGAESYYLTLLRGASLGWGWDEAREETAAELAVFADALAEAWEEVLLSPFDADLLLDTRHSRIKAGVLLAQALHHANVHREQVSAILTSLGADGPDISGWAYGRATGGIVPK